MSALDPATVKLFESLIRLAKGIVSACEEWVKTKKTGDGTPYRA